MPNVENNRIQDFKKLISPEEIRTQIPISDSAVKSIEEGRKNLYEILEGKDQRFVVIVGPCSIHDSKSAFEYAEKLKKLQDDLDDKLMIIMRVYFEKPRTTTGWKGLISDSFLDGTSEIESGLKLAREILIKIADCGIVPATELLDPIIAAYLAELVSWVAIGARTTESQTHREMASGLSAPVGFKNNTDGNLDVAVNAMESSKSSHSFLGVNNQGICSVVKTTGNPYSHIVLRGGGGKPNYHMEDIEECEKKLEAKEFDPKIMIDCSHENSGKDYRKQKLVVKDIIAQKQFGNESIFGVMLESNLLEGSQKIPEDLKRLKYGVSVTDSCIGWEETEQILRDLYESL
ncbi:3-deoxy-7-phosphoheptulonate synthase [Patescibacteria group bacterium]